MKIDEPEDGHDRREPLEAQPGCEAALEPRDRRLVDLAEVFELPLRQPLPAPSETHAPADRLHDGDSPGIGRPDGIGHAHS